MNPESASEPGARSPHGVRWAAWTLLIPMGGTVVVAVIAAFVTAVRDGLHLGTLPFLVAIGLLVVLFLALRASFHPIRGRTDESRAWRETLHSPPPPVSPATERWEQPAGGWCRAQINPHES